MRKAQVTLFVIIGLVLVLIVALFLLMSTSPDQPGEQIIHDFTQATANYEFHVENCLLQEGTIVFQTIMANAGYYDPQAAGFVAIDSMPMRGSALSLSENRIVPFWLTHSGLTCTGPGCTVQLRYPQLISGSGQRASIQEQAQLALVEPMRTCTQSLDLKPDYELVQSQDMRVEVTIAQGAVTYQYFRPVTITHLGTQATKDLNEVSARSTTRLKEMYDIGLSLLQQLEISNQTTNFGHLISTVIQAYSMDDMSLPPMYGGTEFSTSTPKTWLLNEVKDKLAVHLADNIPLLHIPGTRTPRLFLDDNPSSQAIYHSEPFVPALHLPHEQALSRLDIEFLYQPNWDFDVSINPSRGYLIQPQSGTFLPLPILHTGFIDYRFTYDVHMPIIVIITDPDSFNGEGLTLMYAVQTGLRNNEPLSHGQDMSLADDTYPDLFSQPEQRSYGVITINATDLITHEPLEEAELFYVCAESSTSAGITNSHGVARTNLPFCLGGLLTGRLSNYHPIPEQLNVFDDEDASVNIQFSPMRTFHLELRNRLLAKSIDNNFLTIWDLGGSEGFIHEDDNVIYVFTKHTSQGEEELVRTGTINLSNQEEQTIDLAVGTYDLEVFVVRHFGQDRSNPHFIVPEDSFTVDTEPFNPFCCEETHTIPEVKFNQSMFVGGLELVLAANTQVEVTAEDLTKNTLKLTYIAINLADIQKHEDLEAIGMIEEISRHYNESLQPVFIDR